MFASAVPFTTTTLRAAVSAWCNDPVAAAATYGDISSWDTSDAEDFSKLFRASSGGHCSSSATFNDDVSFWNTSKVTTLKDVFLDAQSFNRYLAWDTSKVVVC